MKKIVLSLIAVLFSGWMFANHWTPEGSSFEDNMTFTSVISINNNEQQSADLEVGVFCGEVCRGSQKASYSDGYGSLANPYVLNFTDNTTDPQPAGVLIELFPGWNWISYLLTTETPLEEALVNLTPNEGDMIKSQDKFSSYTSGSWGGTLTTLIPGRGLIYLNNSNQTKSFYYPPDIR